MIFGNFAKILFIYENRHHQRSARTAGKSSGSLDCGARHKEGPGRNRSAQSPEIRPRTAKEHRRLFIRRRCRHGADGGTGFQDDRGAPLPARLRRSHLYVAGRRAPHPGGFERTLAQREYHHPVRALQGHRPPHPRASRHKGDFRGRLCRERRRDSRSASCGFDSASDSRCADRRDFGLERLLPGRSALPSCLYPPR